MWNGPPGTPLQRPFHRYCNHLWRYSGGDMPMTHPSNDWPAMCCLKYPKTLLQRRTMAQPGAPVPDTQIAVWEFPEMLVNFEQTLYTPTFSDRSGAAIHGDLPLLAAVCHAD